MRNDTIKVLPGDTYSAHLGGDRTAATIAVHSPSGRVIADWPAEDEVILGELVEDVKARGYSVTPWASEAGR